MSKLTSQKVGDDLARTVEAIAEVASELYKHVDSEGFDQRLAGQIEGYVHELQSIGWRIGHVSAAVRYAMNEAARKAGSHV